MRSRSGKVRLKATAEELRSANVLLDDVPPARRLELAAIFGNARPVEVEVGPGKGAFLLRRATRRPELNLLGVEWVRNYAWYAADRARRAGRGNVRLLCADAQLAFASCLPQRSVQRIHVYIPDPWPKVRHHRRRLVTTAFLDAARRALCLGGWLGIVTDHEGYFRQMRMALAAAVGLAPVRFLPQSQDWLVGSNFERKYAAGGRAFHAAAAIRWQ